MTRAVGEDVRARLRLVPSDGEIQCPKKGQLAIGRCLDLQHGLLCTCPTYLAYTGPDPEQLRIPDMSAAAQAAEEDDEMSQKNGGTARVLVWYAIGEADAIRDLLAEVWYLGKKRSVGLGAVREWTVEPWEPWEGFPVVRDGRALRPLPPDWPGLVDPVLAYRTLSPPYWMRERAVLVAVPEVW